MPTPGKQTVSLDTLLQLGKTNLAEPNSRLYNNEDINVVVSGHAAFLTALASHTQRLNPTSMTLVAKELFKLPNREGQQYGEALAKALSHCIKAGSKATTGEKLSPDVMAVFNASCKAGDKLKVKPELPVKRSLQFKPESLELMKQELSSPPRPTKSLKVCLSSPNEIAKLYSGSSSSNTTKVRHMH